jgi:DNA polymerase III subunit alpha
LADALSGVRGGRSDIVVRAMLDDGREAKVLLGRDFLIDGELADAMGEIAGVVSVSLTNAEAPRLALVS